MSFTEIFFPLVFAVLVDLLLYTLWYGNFFSIPWLTALRRDKGNVNFPSKELQENMRSPFLAAVFFSIIKASVMQRLLIYARVESVSDVSAIAIWVYIGLIASSSVPNALWADRPLGLILINTSGKNIYNYSPSFI